MFPLCHGNKGCVPWDNSEQGLCPPEVTEPFPQVQGAQGQMDTQDLLTLSPHAVTQHQGLKLSPVVTPFIVGPTKKQRQLNLHRGS